MNDEEPNEDELKAGVRVDPALADLHDVGCVKRYGAESTEMCACEKRRALESVGQHVYTSNVR